MTPADPGPTPVSPGEREVSRRTRHTVFAE
jgi:hypothetical protein